MNTWILMNTWEFKRNTGEYWRIPKEYWRILETSKGILENTWEYLRILQSILNICEYGQYLRIWEYSWILENMNMNTWTTYTEYPEWVPPRIKHGGSYSISYTVQAYLQGTALPVELELLWVLQGVPRRDVCGKSRAALKETWPRFPNASSPPGRNLKHQGMPGTSFARVPTLEAHVACPVCVGK